MARSTKGRMEKWPARRAVEMALLRPRADMAWCTYGTVAWLALRARDVSLGIPFLTAAVPGSRTTPTGQWSRLDLMEADMPDCIVEAERGGRRFHVRLDNGERHEGATRDCTGACLAERVMSE